MSHLSAMCVTSSDKPRPHVNRKNLSLRVKDIIMLLLDRHDHHRRSRHRCIQPNHSQCNIVYAIYIMCSILTLLCLQPLHSSAADCAPTILLIIPNSRTQATPPGPSLSPSLPLPSFLFPFPCSSSNLRNCGRSWSFSQSSHGSGDSKLSPLLRPYQPCCSQTRLTVGEAVASVDMYSLGLGSLPVYIHVYIDLQILLAKIIPCSRCSGLVTSTWEFFYKRANMSEIYTSADISACSDPATVL